MAKSFLFFRGAHTSHKRDSSLCPPPPQKGDERPTKRRHLECALYIFQRNMLSKPKSSVLRKASPFPRGVKGLLIQTFFGSLIKETLILQGFISTYITEKNLQPPCNNHCKTLMRKHTLAGMCAVLFPSSVKDSV